MKNDEITNEIYEIIDFLNNKIFKKEKMSKKLYNESNFYYLMK